MKYTLAIVAICLAVGIAASTTSTARAADSASLEQQFHGLPIEARRLTGPLFWLHGDDSRERLEMYVGKVREGGNGAFTTESRPHNDWLGPGWWRDLGICLDAAKKNGLEMWIFDEKWWPSQSVAGRVPPQYAAKKLTATAVDVDGPQEYSADGFGGDRYVAAVAGRLAADGRVDGATLVDLATSIRNGKLSWSVPAGKWKVMKFAHEQAPLLQQTGQPAVDGASKNCVDWFLQTVYEPHYQHFKADFGRTIRGFFFDEPETPGDWGTDLNATLAAWNVDWKKAYVAYKFELAGDEQTAAKYQYLDAFSDTWGRTMYGGTTRWCQERGVKSIGHFMEHGSLYIRPDFCAGDMLRLARYCSMGGIDAVFSQFAVGKRVTYDAPTWQTPKIASSVSHVFGAENDESMVEIFGARGQDLTYSEMKWWADHMQVSGVNFLIPHSFNPRSPYDNDCPPYFYDGGFEPRWPLYRIFADYTSRLTLMLTGGRHVCPVAILFGGNTARLGKAVMPEEMTSALQDSQYDSDWLPFDAFERDASFTANEIKLRGERYRVLVVPPVEVIPYTTLAKAKAFFDRGGVVVGYGFLPSKSATIGHGNAEIAALDREIWGDNIKPGTSACKTNAAGGRSYFLSEVPKPAEVAAALVDAGLHPGLEVLEGKTEGWLHVLHRIKSEKALVAAHRGGKGLRQVRPRRAITASIERDVFLIANQNHQGEARVFKFRATAAGEPELWDAMRDEITAIPYRRIDNRQVEFSLTLEPYESTLVVFQPAKIARPMRIEPGTKPVHEPIAIQRDPNPPVKPLVPDPKGRPVTLGPVKAADPFRGRVTIPADVNLAGCRAFLEMDELSDNAAAVKVNGAPAGGVIGKPTRLDVTRHLKPGENTVTIEPLSPKAARIVIY